MPLPAHFERELELARVERGRGLAGVAADGGVGRVAERTHVAYVEAVEEVEHVGDGVQLQVLPEQETPRNAHVPLEEARPDKPIAPEVSVAARWRRDALNAKRRAAVSQTRSGEGEGHAR